MCISQFLNPYFPGVSKLFSLRSTLCNIQYVYTLIVINWYAFSYSSWSNGDMIADYEGNIVEWYNGDSNSTVAVNFSSTASVNVTTTPGEIVLSPVLPPFKLWQSCLIALCLACLLYTSRCV